MGTSTRSHTAAARRSLVTIFDDAAARHATTPATPTVSAAPAAQSAGALFLDAVRRLAKESFDERAAKLVIKKVYDDKHGRFDGTESNVNSVFARLVLALRDIFVTEESAFSSLFDLEDATLPVRAEANKLLFSTLEFIVAPVSPAADWMESSAEAHPFDGERVLLEIARMLLDSGGPFQGTADLLAIKINQFDPSRAIAAFNAALRSARRKSTLDDMEVKSLFLKSLDPVFYAPVVNRLLLHDQRAAESLATIQQWTRECHAQHGTDSHVPPATRTFSALTLAGRSDDEDYKTVFSELRDQLYDMKKEIKALNNRLDDTKGYTPRNDKKNAIGRGGHGDGVRFAAKPLPEHGNFPQNFRGKSSGKVAFHKPTGTFVPLCRHPACSATAEKHWHRYCPNGGPRGHVGAHGFSIADSENDMLAVMFQNAVGDDDAARFDAVCCIADGKPDLYDAASAFSFAVAEERVPDTIDEYLGYRQPADTRLGVCAVGGATNIHNFKIHDEVRADALDVPPPPAPPSAPQSVVSDEGMYPVSALHAHEPHATFMLGQALGCGRPPMGFGFSALTSLAVCLMFVICATAAPSRECSAPTSSATGRIGDEVGGAGVLTPTAIPPDLYWQPEGWYGSWYRTTYGYGWTWLPAPPQPPEAAPIVAAPPSPGGAPPSPDYEPPAWGGGTGDALSSSIQRRAGPIAPGATACGDIGTSSILSICSTHDLTDSGTSSPGRCDSGTGSPGHFQSG
ncbi:hypothetical protein CYMTET_47000 [Cymbomonas tetramitiformis]|uniref:Uncharacterized protein n=1 Tax=Cymbomonas tetramitiformis TaxID=36881 RepID=A0AAE0BWV1_9CHLO|nr:hypothetical protein CYMTET_47000 [Cymbomonas tetramitiformis]